MSKAEYFILFVAGAIVILLTPNCALLRESAEFVKVAPEKAREIDDEYAKQIKQFRCEVKFPNDKAQQDLCVNVPTKRETRSEKQQAQK